MEKRPPGSLFASCHCGNVEVTATGNPILTCICYCDDCQKGARHIEGLAGAQAVAEDGGGTMYTLFREDRINCVKGATLLKPLKLNGKTATNRIMATCCNAAMYLSFDDSRHWVSVYRARFKGTAPPVEMRVCTKYRRSESDSSSDLPSFAGYPLRFMVKLVGARIAMLLDAKRGGVHGQSP